MNRSIFYIVCLSLLCSSNTKPESSRETQENQISVEKPVLELPSPAQVHLIPGGRFGSRYEGNANYLGYQHEHYDSFMLESFATRHYAPGKLLERVWDGEYAGKWLDAAARVSVNTGNEAQLAQVDQFVESLLKHQQEDGFLGIKLPTDRQLDAWEREWDNWNLWNALNGLLTHYELRGSQQSLAASSAIGNWIIHTYGPLRKSNEPFLQGEVIEAFTNVVVIGQLVRLYRHTGDRDYLDFVEQVIAYHPPIQEMLATGKPYLLHPYMLSAVLGGIVAYASETEDKHLLSTVESIWTELEEKHLYPTGSLGEREDLDEDPIRDVPGGQLQETCATTEWIFLNTMLFEITGKERYVAALERTCYNALLAAQSTDGMRWCYWTPLRYSKDWFHGPTRCCFWSGPRGIARLPQLIYATKGNIIYVNFFESSQALLQTQDGAVEIRQESNFPGSGSSTLMLKSPPEWSGTLRIRVPDWATDFQVSHPSGTVQKLSDAKGYIDIPLRESTNHKIQIGFEIPLILEALNSQGYVIRRGPEVLSLDIRDNIDTWLGSDELISIPEKISFLETESFLPYQWPGPESGEESRRQYRVEVEDARTDELRSVILTPYADAGNEGAAFRTVFPMATEE